MKLEGGSKVVRSLSMRWRSLHTSGILFDSLNSIRDLKTIPMK